MARNWFTFDISPSGKYGCAGAEKYQPFRAEVEDWLLANQHKSVKLTVIQWKDHKDTITPPPSPSAPKTVMQTALANHIKAKRPKDEYEQASHLRVKLRSVRDAVLFKLFWSDYICDGVEATPGGLNSVILPLIRRVMPSVVAHDIIGCQPMTGPVGAAFTLKVKYPSKAEEVAALLRRGQ